MTMMTMAVVTTTAMPTDGDDNNDDNGGGKNDGGGNACSNGYAMTVATPVTQMEPVVVTDGGSDRKWW